MASLIRLSVVPSKRYRGSQGRATNPGSNRHRSISHGKSPRCTSGCENFRLEGYRANQAKTLEHPGTLMTPLATKLRP